MKKRVLPSVISSPKITNVKAVEPQRVCHLFEFDIFDCLDLKPVLEKQEVVDNRIKTLRGLGDEFVVTNPFGITIGLFFSFARNARRKVLKVYIKADWQST